MTAPSRAGSPESTAVTRSKIVTILLAAGRGLRFDPQRSKMLADFAGRPLARQAAETAIASRACRTVVVTGHGRVQVEAALADLPVEFVHNSDHASGIASSLRVGLSTVGDAMGALILLGDMPRVTAEILDHLIAVFEGAGTECPAVVPLCGGRRGNPVLLGRAVFANVAGLSGDEGARRLLQSTVGIIEASIGDSAVLTDVDTRADLERLLAEGDLPE
jgi:molybdenum cofactor cytidylyltransferase